MMENALVTLPAATVIAPLRVAVVVFESSEKVSGWFMPALPPVVVSRIQGWFTEAVQSAVEVTAIVNAPELRLPYVPVVGLISIDTGRPCCVTAKVAGVIPVAESVSMPVRGVDNGLPA